MNDVPICDFMCHFTIGAAKAIDSKIGSFPFAPLLFIMKLGNCKTGAASAGRAEFRLFAKRGNGSLAAQQLETFEKGELNLRSKLKRLWLGVGFTLLALLTACGGTEEKPGAAATASPSASTPSPSATKAPPTTLSMMVESHPTWPYKEDWPVWKWIEEAANVKVQAKLASGVYNDALNVTIASKDMPDLLYMSSANASKFGQQGALVNLKDHLSVMPNLSKFLKDNPEAAQQFTAGDGKMYIAPNLGIGETNRQVWMYREDIFKKHQVKPPASFDELYATLKKLKELYPDSYPFTFRHQAGITGLIGTNFGLPGSVYTSGAGYDADAKTWEFTPIQEEQKKMVEFLAKLYKEKLIPPDYLTTQTKQWEDQINNNQAFITFDNIGRIDSFNASLRQVTPGAGMTFMTPPGSKNINLAVNTVGLSISSLSKNVKAAAQYLDFYYSEQGRLLSSWGKEGVTYTVENGVKKFKPDYANVTELRQKTGLSTNGTYGWFDFDAHLALFSPELRSAHEQARKVETRPQLNPALNSDENQNLGILSASITKYVDESTSKFIIGEKNISEWSKYVEELQKMGAQKLVDLYKAANERAMKAN
ncbi:MAG: transporter substrate-binding protein [Paenibacillus sp.]|nr:transporter substrate-binding protein [Paenibacillus sp.]